MYKKYILLLLCFVLVSCLNNNLDQSPHEDLDQNGYNIDITSKIEGAGNQDAKQSQGVSAR